MKRDENIKGYADSDWARDKTSMKSTSGGVVYWGAAPIKTWSTNQTVIALRSGEAELYALSKCAQQCASIASIAADFGIKTKVQINSDSNAAIGIAFRTGLGGKPDT